MSLSTFTYFRPDQATTVSRSHLPHWDQAGATYFITWRTADSLPKPILEQWLEERRAWLLDLGIEPARTDWHERLEAKGERIRKEFHPRFSAKLEERLDEGHGACLLRDPRTSEIVAQSLHKFDGVRYALGSFVIMPNHVHLIVGGIMRDCMLRQVAGWKRWTARMINERSGTQGRFWQAESFDHLIRSSEAHRRFRAYILENPAKAGLQRGFLLGSGRAAEPTVGEGD